MSRNYCSFVFLFLLFFLISVKGIAQPSFNKYREGRSNSHDEALALYRQLESAHPWARLLELEETDSGRPLHLFVMDRTGSFDPEKTRAQDKLVLLINNGIHAGESCGVDASLLFAKDLLEKKRLPENVIILIIPVFNIGGSLNRSCCSRANQVGPEEQGFRGNARLLDLNRDFIKAGSRNVKEFTRIFRQWDPHLFIDTHTTNGADYQYTMTLIHTQHDKLGGTQGKFLRDAFVPALYGAMEDAGEPVTPYVNVFRSIPDSGFAAFLETPRYATGYTALFQCLGFVTEAHMFKPFRKRVEATHTFLSVFLEVSAAKSASIINARKVARDEIKSQTWFPLAWDLDSARKETFHFLGYGAEYRSSEVTGEPMLFYNQENPFHKQVPFFPHYRVSDSTRVPEAYLVPQAWHEVVERLRMNGVNMTRLERDTLVEADFYRIETINTLSSPFEGHYLHTGVETSVKSEKVRFLQGDYLVHTRQPARRYLVETLEPRSADSFFRWNFFDEILQQKEWYSSYVFDTTAARLLRSDAELSERFERLKREDPEFAGNSDAQLYFIYRHSPAFEPTYMRYPVGLIRRDLPLTR